MRSRHHDAEFHLVGWLDSNPAGISHKELDQWVQSGDIRYHGAVDDVLPYLQSCQVYVLPSYREGRPRTVMEAMSVGRAVITTDAPGCRETVRDGENGFLVPPRDSAALVNAMEKLIRCPELLNQMGRAGRRLAETEYDVREVNKKLLKAMGL